MCYDTYAHVGNWQNFAPVWFRYNYVVVEDVWYSK